MDFAIYHIYHKGTAMIKLAVFDFDSTLMDGETIDFLAKAHGVGAEVSAITERAMNGELDFFESLSRRVSLLAGMPESSAREICQNLPLMPGARECIANLRARGIVCVCFSGGFHLATRYYAGVLGLQADFSNILHVRDGVLSGRVGGDMMFSDSKGDMLVKIQDLLGITQEETIAIGDGANDLSMFAHAAHRVAFCAKPILQQSANIIIEQKDLCEVVRHIPESS